MRPINCAVMPPLFLPVRTFRHAIILFMGRYTPLRLGSLKGTPAVVRALLEVGADATITDFYGRGMVCECVYGANLVISGMS